MFVSLHGMILQAGRLCKLFELPLILSLTEVIHPLHTYQAARVKNTSFDEELDLIAECAFFFYSRWKCFYRDDSRASAGRPYERQGNVGLDCHGVPSATWV